MTVCSSASARPRQPPGRLKPSEVLAVAGDAAGRIGRYWPIGVRLGVLLDHNQSTAKTALRARGLEVILEEPKPLRPAW